MTTPRPAQTLTLLPLTINLALYAGDDVELAITVADSTGANADLTAAVIRSQIRVTADSGSVLAEWDATVDPGNSLVTLRLHSADTGALPARSVWDCSMQQADWVTALAAGVITVTPNVSRW